MTEHNKNQGAYNPRKATLGEALITFIVLIAIMFVSIIVFEVDPHMPMFIGVIIAALMALKIGYTWGDIESSMVKGITQALQSIIILAVIGILVGVWITAGVVPSMIYYGLMILKPSIFLVAAVLICSITSIATGSSWGTAGTMGIALMGIAQGMGIPLPVAAGAVISGAYFGDKMSPLSDTTNLAPAMAGTDVFTHIKAMAKPTIISYIIALVFFGIMTTRYNVAGADTSAVVELQQGLSDSFNISPLLLLPPVIVIVSIAFKMPALPGIAIGIIVAAIMGPIFQDIDFGIILSAGKDGFVSETGIEALDSLLTAGGLMGMMSSISLTIIAMMFGGIAERTGQLEAIIHAVLGGVKSVTGLVSATIFTCFLSNITMPEQYISIVVPGRMYAPVYAERGLHPKLLSATLEASGTVTSALIPWNTCGVYLTGVLKVSTFEYLPFAVFNIAMPIVTIILTAIGQNVFWAKDDPDTIVHID
ncbi:Na+/H+ antiporter NhaC [Peptoniphilus sp. KCTC 25270]|uniref:Na+/H+ antiporter NhaC n=1 Tax=Peptoniphilus sp. KCTC 25270 TaxID=2897414 RepID=UPI001E5363DE|nr:Na+/H+ antiporter NhaC [Peptoniphilus sp. KCTC 25270]MCD1147800.1 Na+/H+ antiporter NhaC [Peptoniphilus sp. KCTC 25270]